MTESGLRTWLGLCFCGFVLVSVAATPADAARFRLSLRGHDSLAWSVGSRATCGRSGTGLQSVDFRSTHSVTVQIKLIRFRRGGRTLRGLVFKRADGSLTINGTGTVRRTDDTTGFKIRCEDFGPKDCATRPLDRFDPTIASSDRGGFTLEGAYWQSAESPFQNCIALETPVATANAGAGPPYLGWKFGNEVLFRDTAPLATRTVSPEALRVGRTYHFDAFKSFDLRDSDLHGRFDIGSNGGSGGPNTFETDSPGGTLGGDRSISDVLSWEITLKRIS